MVAFIGLAWGVVVGLSHSPSLSFSPCKFFMLLLWERIVVVYGFHFLKIWKFAH
jgi:hypothetical protein